MLRSIEKYPWFLLLAGLAGAATGAFPAIADGTAEEHRQASELIAKAVAALGGSERLDAVKSLETTMTIELASRQGDTELRRTTTLVFPDRMRQETQMPQGSMVRVVDGEEGFLLMGSRARSLSSSRLAEARDDLQRDLVGLLQRRGDEGFTAVPASTDGAQRDTVAKSVEVSFDGDAVILAIDSDSGRVLSLAYDGRLNGRPGRVLEVLSDYREVGGLTLPFATNLTVDGEAPVTVKVESIIVDGTIDPALFTAPDEAATTTLAAPKVSEAERVTAERLIAGVVAALGGAERLDAVKSLETLVAVAPTGGRRAGGLSRRTLLVFPDRLRSETQTPMGRLVRVVDGDAGYLLVGARSRPLGAERLAQARDDLRRDLVGLLRRRGEKGFVAKPAGSEKIDGVTVEVVEVWLDGDSIRLGIEPESRRVLSLTYEGSVLRQKGTVRKVLSDYRQVSGLKLPFEAALFLDGEPIAELTVERIDVDGGIDDRLFEVPAKSPRTTPTTTKPGDRGAEGEAPPTSRSSGR